MIKSTTTEYGCNICKETVIREDCIYWEDDTGWEGGHIAICKKCFKKYLKKDIIIWKSSDEKCGSCFIEVVGITSSHEMEGIKEEHPYKIEGFKLKDLSIDDYERGGMMLDEDHWVDCEIVENLKK